MRDSDRRCSLSSLCGTAVALRPPSLLPISTLRFNAMQPALVISGDNYMQRFLSIILFDRYAKNQEISSDLS